MQKANINTPEYWNTIYRAEWETGRAEGPACKRDYGPIHDAVVGLIPDGSQVLDVACGLGLLCSKIKQQRPGCQVLGVDFSEYTLARNRERDRTLGVEYRCMDVRNSLPTLVGPFDVLTMCEILEHLEQPESVVASAFDLLRPGGRFVLTCPHDDAIPDPEHVRLWSHDDLFHLLAPYSDTVSFMHFPPPYYHRWVLAYLTKNPVVIRAETPK